MNMLSKGVIYTLASLALAGCGKSVTGPDNIDNGEDPINNSRTPVLNSFQINNGSRFANSRDVMLYFQGMDADSVKLEGFCDKAFVNTRMKVPYSDSISVRLDDGSGLMSDGSVELAATLYSRDGKASDRKFSSIVLDTKAPSLGLEDVVAYDKSIRLVSPDSLKDIAGGSYSLSGATSDSGDISDLANIKSFNDGVTRVSVNATDSAGNSYEKSFDLTVSKLTDEAKALDIIKEEFAKFSCPIEASNYAVPIAGVNGDASTYYFNFDLKFKFRDDSTFITYVNVLFDNSGQDVERNTSLFESYNALNAQGSTNKFYLLLTPDYESGLRSSVQNAISQVRGNNHIE